MTRYVVAPLTIDELNALQNAIIGGAFSNHAQCITAQMVANKGYDQIVDNLARDLDALRRAGSAIMSAKPEGGAS